MGAIALHGTYDDTSIGNNKSLGCIRLTNADIEQVFPFVPKGAEVRILSTGNTPHPNRIVKETSRLIPSVLPQHSESADGVTFHWLG
ncbi:L,D-transpeptidase [compost metagenome]